MNIIEEFIKIRNNYDRYTSFDFYLFDFYNL